MITEHKITCYIGNIVAVVDNVSEQPKPSDEIIDELLGEHKSLEHIVVVTVPGVFEKVKAYPRRDQCDEPKIGDLCVIYAWDPVYNSYCIYEKLREDEVVGFRAHGKLININHERIKIGVFDESTEYKDNEIPETPIAHIDLDKDGNITVHSSKDLNMYVEGDATINVKGNCKIIADQVLTTTALTWKGNNGTVTPTGKGPFCSIPICPVTGAPHTGNESMGGEGGTESCQKHN